MWSRFNLDRLRFRLPAPENKLFKHKFKSKMQFWNLKLILFLKVYWYLFFLSICVQIVKNVTKFYKNCRFFATSVPLSHTSTARSRSFLTSSGSSKKVRLRLQNTDRIIRNSRTIVPSLVDLDPELFPGSGIICSGSGKNERADPLIFHF